ncbi:MAG: outer membrane protein insertion porin family [Crocinitomicaceae bacterium]|jgi:outer membrane protein insertion porin family
MVLLSLQAEGQTIRGVVYENLTRTKADYLDQQLDINAGDTISVENISRNEQYLKDLNLFFNVEHRIDWHEDSSATLCFIIDEAHYVYPVVSDITTNNKFNFSIGVTDINFLGRAQTIGVLYQYYDRHSIKFFQTAPRHKNNRTGHELFLGKYSTIEPLYFNDESVRFDFDNYHISSALYYWLNRYWKTSLGGMIMYERYKNNDRAIMFQNESFEVGDQFDFMKYQVRNTFTYSRINTHFERRDGLSNHIHSEVIATPEMEEASFVKITNDLRYFKSINKRGNLALRNQIGIATNRNSPFAPFVVDGFVNVRGSGDRVARGTGLVTFNAEYLHTVLKHKWAFCQLGAFTDIAYLRPGGAALATTFKSENSYYYSGLSFRLQTRILYRAVIRFDYGFNLQDLSQGGFTVGFNHFF